MYRKELPEVDDLVMVRYSQSTESVIYCELLEYGNIQGLMILSEFSRSMNGIRKGYFAEGKRDVLRVTEVSAERRAVCVSKRQRTADEALEHAAWFAKTQRVDKIVRALAEELKTTPVELYQQWFWDLYEHHAHAYDALESWRQGREIDTSGLSAEQIVVLRRLVEKYFKKASVKVESIIEVTCFEEAGVNAIKNAFGCIPPSINVQLLASPAYSVWVMTDGDVAEASQRIRDAIETMRLGSPDCTVLMRRDPICDG